MPHDLHNGWLDPLHHGGAGWLEPALKSWRMYRWIQPLEAIIAPPPQSRSDSPRSIVLDDHVRRAIGHVGKILDCASAASTAESVR